MSQYELMHTWQHLKNLGLCREIIIKKVIFGAGSQLDNNEDEEETT